MNTSTSRGFARRPVMALAAAVTLSLGLIAPVQQANAITVIDIPHIAVQGIEFFEQADRWKRTYDQYAEAVASYEAQLKQIQNMFLTLGIKPGMELKEVDEDEYVEERCGSGQGFSLAALVKKVFTIDPKGDIQKQQREICAAIQMMQNTKFNLTVRFLNEHVTKSTEEFNGLNGQITKANNVGDSNAVNLQAQSMRQGQQARMENYQNQMRAYDGYIEIMRDNQRLLAQSALKPRDKKLIGTLVKTATLQGALPVNGLKKPNN